MTGSASSSSPAPTGPPGLEIAETGQKERRFQKPMFQLPPAEPVWPSGKVLSPFLTGRMFVRPNILRTLR